MTQPLHLLQAKSSAGLLPWSAQLEVANTFGQSIAEIEQLALDHGLLPSRYQRNGKNWSSNEQRSLFSTRVAVIGCGGLGGYALEQLARIGIGELIAIDPDTFEEHNLNRQLFATIDNLGMAKVEATQRRIAAINPAITVTPCKQAFTSKRATTQLNDVDIVVDCLDSPAVRLELAASCEELNLPLVHGAISGWYGQICVVHPGSGALNRFYRHKNNPGTSTGNPSFTPGLVASLQVAEVIKLILGKGYALDEHALHIDLLDMEISEIPL